MKQFLEKYFGPNWRTSVSGWGSNISAALTLLAALPYELGDVATIISPELKAQVVKVGIISTFLLRWWNSNSQKSKVVSGTPGEGYTVAPKPDNVRQIPPSNHQPGRRD